MSTKERGIIAYPHELRAMRSGKLSQIRRRINPQPNGSLVEDIAIAAHPVDDRSVWYVEGNQETEFRSRLGRVGDRIWIKETHGFDLSNKVYYFEGFDDRCGWSGEWISEKKMPRDAARFIYEITSVRAETLQELTPKDAIACGCMPSVGSGLDTPENFQKAAELVGGPYPRGIFAMLWETIHGQGAWARNEWVWVADLKKCAP